MKLLFILCLTVIAKHFDAELLKQARRHCVPEYKIEFNNCKMRMGERHMASCKQAAKKDTVACAKAYIIDH